MVADEQSDAVAYFYTSKQGSPCAALFCGKRNKPDFRYRFINESQRQKHVDSYFASRRVTIGYKAKVKAERQAAPRGVEVGDILVCSWGYSMTLVDFYQVVGTKGKYTVELRKIASEVTKGDAGYSGNCIGVKDAFVDDKILTKQCREGTVKISSHQSARKWVGVREYYFNRMD